MALFISKNLQASDRRTHHRLQDYYSAPIINLAGKEYVCSCCGASFDEPWEECPECGVKMKKIKYDPVYVDEAEMLDILLEDE